MADVAQLDQLMRALNFSQVWAPRPARRLPILNVTQRAFSITQRALSVTQRALSITQ